MSPTRALGVFKGCLIQPEMQENNAKGFIETTTAKPETRCRKVHILAMNLLELLIMGKSDFRIADLCSSFITQLRQTF